MKTSIMALLLLLTSVSHADKARFERLSDGLIQAEELGQWRRAIILPGKAKKKLEEVAKGNFKPLPGSLSQPDYYNKPAVREAKLLLAGTFRREGKIREAKALYEELTSGKDTTAHLAKSYLATLK